MEMFLERKIGDVLLDELSRGKFPAPAARHIYSTINQMNFSPIGVAYSAPTELKNFLETESYKDSTPTVLPKNLCPSMSICG